MIVKFKKEAATKHLRVLAKCLSLANEEGDGGGSLTVDDGGDLLKFIEVMQKAIPKWLAACQNVVDEYPGLTLLRYCRYFKVK